MKNLIKTTEVYNNMIFLKIQEYMNDNPNIPFCKILQDLNINRKEELMGLVDTEKELSEETFRRIKNEQS